MIEKKKNQGSCTTDQKWRKGKKGVQRQELEWRKVSYNWSINIKKYWTENGERKTKER